LWSYYYCTSFLSQDTYTALGIAARLGHTDVVTMLVEAGAYVDYKDSQVQIVAFYFICAVIIVKLRNARGTDGLHVLYYI
jgi:hypothetical protein